MTISDELKEKLITFITEAGQEYLYKADYCYTSCSCDNLRAKCSECAAPYEEAYKEANALLNELLYGDEENED